MSERYAIDWFLERLEGVEGGQGSWQAWCPVHDDVGTAVKGLSISEGRNGRVLCTCHSPQCKAGIEDVVSVLEGRENGDEPRVVVTSHASRNGPGGMTWWAQKTGVDESVWDDMGCVAYQGGVAFLFAGETYFKYRMPGEKNFGWEPKGAEAPPLWPIPEDEMPAEISIWEGESDAGTARAGGLPRAYAVTKGAKTPIPGKTFEALRKRGVEKVLIGGDTDDAGNEFARRLSSQAVAAGLTVQRCDLDRILDPFSGLNDLNGVWRNCETEDDFLELIARATHEIAIRIQFQSVQQMEEKAEEEVQWLIPDLIAPGDKILLAAPQKSLKSWTALEQVRSLTTGAPFLKRTEWTPSQPLRVGFVQEEGAASLWARRIAMLGISGNTNAFFAHRIGFSFTEPSFIDEIIATARDHELQMLIFDPLQRMIPGIDENSASEIGIVWDEVARIQQALPHLVVEIVHHARKDSTMSWDSTRGSGRHGGEVDVGFFIERHPTEERRLRMWLDGRDIPQYLGTGEAFEIKYTIDREANVFEMDANEIAIATTNPTLRGRASRETVLKAVREGHDTRTKIMHETGMSDSTVIRQLDKLVADGEVTETEHDNPNPNTYA